VLAFLQRNRGFVVVGVLLLLPLVLLYAQSKKPGARGPITGLVVDSTAGVERLLLMTTGLMSDVVAQVGAAWQDGKELAQRRRQDASVPALQAKVNELSLENERLRGLARVAATLDGPMALGARVIGRAGMPVSRTLRVDRGSRDGVARGDGVISKDGVVGIVRSVGYTAAEVLLVTHASAAMDVLVQRTRAHGLLRGIGEVDRYACEVSNFDRLSDVKSGDVIITAGIATRFPTGLVVGTVAEVATNERALTLSAVVRPAADVANVEEVLILIQRPLQMPPVLGDDMDANAPLGGRQPQPRKPPPPAPVRTTTPKPNEAATIAPLQDAGPSTTPVADPVPSAPDAGVPASPTQTGAPAPSMTAPTPTPTPIPTPTTTTPTPIPTPTPPATTPAPTANADAGVP
jgi:rod shape-determining protein MreC